MRSGLEQALVEPSAMYAYLHYLNHTHHVQVSSGPSNLLPNERVDQILAEGLDCLSPEELAEFAINPLQLLDVRDQLEDEEPCEHWLSIFARDNCEFAEMAEVLDGPSVTAAKASFPPTRRAAKRHPLMAFDSVDDRLSPSVSSDLTTGRNWFVEIPLNSSKVEPNSSKVEWLDVIDAAQTQQDQQRTVRIDFQWQPDSPSSVLTVRLGAPLLLAGQCHGEVLLLDEAGKTVAEGQRHETEFHVKLAPADPLRVRQLKVIYDRPGKYRVQITIPLSLSQ